MISGQCRHHDRRNSSADGLEHRTDARTVSRGKRRRRSPDALAFGHRAAIACPDLEHEIVFLVEARRAKPSEAGAQCTFCLGSLCCAKSGHQSRATKVPPASSVSWQQPASRRMSLRPRKQPSSLSTMRSKRSACGFPARAWRSTRRTPVVAQRDAFFLRQGRAMAAWTALPTLPPGPCSGPNSERAGVEFVIDGRSAAAEPSDFYFERMRDASGISITTERSSAPFGSLDRQSMLI